MSEVGYDDLFFFFFKQKTAYEMRISDWSSDVCSSDLEHTDAGYTGADVMAAYNAFNQCLLYPVRKLYRRDTEAEKEVGAIWTQAIYWDMAMNAYKKTGSEAHRQLVSDIFKGNYEHYDRFNWDNGKVWFIYDDIM